jgi:diguanylate cyclase (GGDEF)-like protein
MVQELGRLEKTHMSSGHPVPMTNEPPSQTAQNTEPSPRTLLDPALLAKLDVLKGVSLESVQDLLECCPLREIVAGEQLLHKGQVNSSIYLVLSGRLAIHLDSIENEPLTFVEAGDMVGELSMLDEQPVSGHVVASEPTRLLVVEQATFWTLVVVSHNFTINLLMGLGRRLRANNVAVLEAGRLRDHFEHAALFDALTGLRNRRWLDQMLPRFVARSAFGGEPLSLLVIDIDHFKRFNDSFGHQAGDRVLALGARTIVENVRPTDHVARFGGEEIVVVLVATDAQGARVAAERLREKVAGMSVAMPDGGDLPKVTISVGLAEFAASQRPEQLFDAADAAMYRAKQNGRNRVEG